MLISIYRLVLHLLPAELRRKHGSAMELLFVRELEHARVRGSLREAIAGVAGIWDVVQRSAYEVVRNTQMENPHMQLPTTRELLRRHALSFAVAFVALTSVLLLQFAIRQVMPLSARGASAGTIAEALLFALPFIAAMTIPMAVLIAVLHVFTRLGANGTLASARLVRDGARRLVVPVIVAAAGVTALAFVVTAEIVPRANERLASVLAGNVIAPGDRSMTIGALRQAAHNVGSTELGDRSRVASYEVEIQKKLALPVSCLMLALVGMALAFRIPRGGVTLVFGGSLVLFAAYYALIMIGETLADQLVVSPFVGMWGANAFVLTVALVAAWWRRGSITSSGPGAVGIRG